MKYSELLQHLNNLTPEQLQCDVTVQLAADCVGDECYPAELKICDYDHGVLDENHPVIFAG